MTDAQKSYAKWIADPNGRLIKRYHATDPADPATACGCGMDACPMCRLLPFRRHIVELHRALTALHEEELAVCDPAPWASVLYALRMAASIEDVEADTGHVVDTMTFALCESTIDYEAGQSEVASKYVAAATVFNFIWQAYEAAVAETAPDELRRLAKEARSGERGRRLLEARPEMDARFAGIADLVGVALRQCRGGGLMDDRCDRVSARFGETGLVAAAELTREFRNFLFHGGDEAPRHEDWNYGDGTVPRDRLHRFYSNGRLLLLLIQSMSWITHRESPQVFRCGPSARDFTARDMLERVHFRGPGPWPPIDPAGGGGRAAPGQTIATEAGE